MPEPITFIDTIELVVVSEFKSYKPGDVISDPGEIHLILNSEHELYVVKRLKNIVA